MKNPEVELRGEFELRVSLGDMAPDDAFSVVLPSRLARLTVGDLLNRVFPEEEAEQLELLDALDVRDNPDLPDMYDELLDIFDQWRQGDCTLRFFARHGPQVELFHAATAHVSQGCPAGPEAGYPVLHLVIEQRFEVLARFAEWGGDREGLTEWLRSCTLLYFMDKHRFSLQSVPSDELDRWLLPIADELRSRNLVDLSVNPRGTQEYGIAEHGRQFIGQLLIETESYIDSFEVFSDVLYDLDTQSVEFGTGHGSDLRVQVYESEGLDPIRVVFLLRLYDSTLDLYADTWREEIRKDEFFDEILRPVLDHDRVDDALIGWVIESGYAHNEEIAEEATQRESDQDTLRRIQRE